MKRGVSFGIREHVASTRIGKSNCLGHDTFLKGSIDMSDELSEAMGRLHQELAQNPQLDASKIESLRALASEIQHAIGEQETEASRLSEARFSSRIQEYIEALESQHPKLTQTLSMIAERLADMGI
jgi:hypothetical protein